MTLAWRCHMTVLFQALLFSSTELLPVGVRHRVHTDGGDDCEVPEGFGVAGFEWTDGEFFDLFHVLP